MTTEPEEADFVLASGTQAIGRSDGSVQQQSLDELQALLRRCRNIPMVLANPDFVTVSGCGIMHSFLH